jgi:hypothetical protein
MDAEEPVVEVAVNVWSVSRHRSRPSWLLERSRLVDEVGDVPHRGDKAIWYAVGRPGDASPSLLIGLPSSWLGSGNPIREGVLVIPETERVFVATDDYAVCYAPDQDRWQRLWALPLEHAFSVWGWRCHDDVVLLTGEVGLWAFSIEGASCGPRGSSRPGTSRSRAERRGLDVCGTLFGFPVRSGPTEPTTPRFDRAPGGVTVSQPRGVGRFLRRG